MTEPITTDELAALQDKVISDPYLLRGLAWCGLCERELVAVLASTGDRYYGCPSQPCKQTLVPAKEIESLVWQRFVRLNEAAAAAVRSDERQAALRGVLKSVTVHSDAIDLWFGWRD